MANPSTTRQLAEVMIGGQIVLTEDQSAALAEAIDHYFEALVHSSEKSGTTTNKLKALGYINGLLNQ